MPSASDCRAAAGYCEHNPTPLKQAFRKAPKVQNRPALTDPAAVGKLMRRIASYNCNDLVRYAIKLGRFKN